MGVFGPIVTLGDVRLAVQETIKLWIGDYLAEVGAQHGKARNDLPVFKSYEPMFDLDHFVDNQIPACVIVAPGTDGTPTERTVYADGSIGIGVGVVISGQTFENTWNLAELYLGAVRTLILQKGSLGGFAQGSKWMGERLDALRTTDSRTIIGGQSLFSIKVSEMSQRRGAGPTTPSTNPNVAPADWPVVQEVDFDPDFGKVTADG